MDLSLCSLKRNKTGVTKGMEKKDKRDTYRAALVLRTAEITGFSERYVRYVIGGGRENETVMATYMELLEGSNELVKRVRELVPFN
jgi:precorrin-6B methylase 2